MQSINKSAKICVVIAGGGTAGWMTACALSYQLGHVLDVKLVESEEIGSVGVGEATIPTIRSFHLLLGIDEQEFVKRTSATFKLGIKFSDWSEIGQGYFHSFGETGKEFWAGQFQHFWLRGRKEGMLEAFTDYSLESLAAHSDKFALTKNPSLNYAYHLDAAQYAAFLRSRSESQGVSRIEGKIADVNLCSSTGNVASLLLETGQTVSGDFFIDCTGFKALLINGALNVSYEDWSDLFLCDSAAVIQTAADYKPVPYTRSIAHAFGWQWRIPIQNRVGNGLVYSGRHISNDHAISVLLNNVEGEHINEPRVITFKPGRRKKQWHKNCVSIGLSSGFIEPLESTSIHLISSSIVRIMRMFPFNGVETRNVDEFNRQARVELDLVKDFVALHYKATSRCDSEFWQYCRRMCVPETLVNRIELYKSCAAIHWAQDELFTANSWNQVMLGQGIVPESYHEAVGAMSSEELKRFMNGYRKGLLDLVQKLPLHADFLQAYVQ